MTVNLPPAVVWIPDRARQHVRCFFCFGWILRGDKLERGLGATGYVAHPDCHQNSQQQLSRFS